MNKLSIYIHLPFCVRKCNYCAFYSLPAIGEETKNAYLTALKKQAETFAPYEQRSVTSVYFGGGTPSLFGAERICELLAFLRTQYRIADGAEITVEVNPGTADAKDLRLLHDAGVNRLSIGMQSSSDTELAMLGRIHGFADVQTCVQNARDAGFDNVSLDLLFALPDQSAETFETSLHDAFAMRPEHLSVYSLQVEDGTPFCERRTELNLPTEEQEETQYDLLCALAREHGYEHYEISSFAREGHYSRHNLHYWQRGEYLGFGAAAHSHWGGKRFANAPDLHAFIEDPTGFDAYKKAERIDETEMVEEDIFLGLRTSFGIPAHLVSAEKVARMVSLGLMGTQGGNVFLTERGFRVSNAVIGQLLV